MAGGSEGGDGNPLTRARLGFLKALGGGAAGTKDRCDMRKIDSDRKPRRKWRSGDNIFREAAVAAVAGVVLVLAHGFPTGLAIFTTHAGIVQPRHADGIARHEIRDPRTERSDYAGNFATRNEWQ